MMNEWDQHIRVSSNPPETRDLDDAWGDAEEGSFESRRTSSTVDVFDRATLVPSMPILELVKQDGSSPFRSDWPVRKLEDPECFSDRPTPMIPFEPYRVEPSDPPPTRESDVVAGVRAIARRSDRARPRARRDSDTPIIEVRETSIPPESPERAVGRRSSRVDAQRTPPPTLQEAKDLYTLGDFAGALAIVQAVLNEDPDDSEARRYLLTCCDALTQVYAGRLGRLDHRVAVAVRPDQLRGLSLDPCAGFLLSLIDGSLTVDELLDFSGMSRIEGLRVLSELRERGVIELSSP